MVDGLRHPDEWLKELAADRCSQVREHLLFLKQRAAQSQAAAILADTVSHVLYSIESELKAAPSPRADEESKFRLTEIHDFLNYLSEDLLRLIEEGESTRIPGGDDSPAAARRERPTSRYAGTCSVHVRSELRVRGGGCEYPTCVRVFWLW